MNKMSSWRILSIAIVASFLAVFFTLSGHQVFADGNFFPLTPNNPYTQNWSNINLITVDDNWNNVPSITGYRGDDASASAGLNPENVLADLSGVVDVNANRSDPNTFATGGVTEFDGIPNPVVALKGSSTADFPHLILRMNTTGCPVSAKLVVSFTARDLDSSSNDAVQQVAVHYRVGSTGNYTNVHSGYISDATDGGAAIRNSFIDSALPDDAKNKSQVFVRILTANAAGEDEWVGIDDIRVRCLVPTAASVDLAGRVTTAEGNGIRNVSVVVSGGDLPKPMNSITGAFGYYAFQGLTAGQTYLITVGAKQYTFSPSSRVITLNDAVDDMDLVADGGRSVRPSVK